MNKHHIPPARFEGCTRSASARPTGRSFPQSQRTLADDYETGMHHLQPPWSCTKSIPKQVRVGVRTWPDSMHDCIQMCARYWNDKWARLCESTYVCVWVCGQPCGHISVATFGDRQNGFSPSFFLQKTLEHRLEVRCRVEKRIWSRYNYLRLPSISERIFLLHPERGWTVKWYFSLERCGTKIFLRLNKGRMLLPHI